VTVRAFVIMLLLATSATLRAQVTPPATTAAPSSGCPSFTTIDEFVYCKAMAILDKQQVGQNGRGSDRQKESPSTDPRSTSLVDQSSATDFISVAASLIPVSPSLSQTGSSGTSSSSQTGAGTGAATTSFYALMAAFNKTSPTDPAFYQDHVFSRRLSFTIGTAASTQATDNTSTPSTVYGGKVLLINRRELYTKDNLKAIRTIQTQLSDETVAAARLTSRIEEIMCASLHPDCVADRALSTVGVILSAPGTGYKKGDILTVGGSGTGATVEVLLVDKDGAVLQPIVIKSSGNKYSLASNVPTNGGSGNGATVNITALSSLDIGVLTTFQNTQLTPANLSSTVKAVPSDAMKQIEATVESGIKPFSTLRTSLNNTYDEISGAMQVSISGAANVRTGLGNNNYRGEFILDKGLTKSGSINWTINGSFDYTDRKNGIDSRGGRVATSFQGDLTRPNGGWSKAPLTLIFSGETDWLSSQKPQYSFDAKLSIPITAGFDLPIEYRFANRAAQINQHDSQVRLGLTIDISRITQALK
jgi:hypothetical protein